MTSNHVENRNFLCYKKANNVAVMNLQKKTVGVGVLWNNRIKFQIFPLAKIKKITYHRVSERI